MKIIEYLNQKEKPTLSFEIFPARNEKAASMLGKAVDKLAAAGPDFISVTFGAGGSTREGSYELVKQLKEDKGLAVLPYLAGYGLGPDEVEAVVGAYAALGMESLLVVRGDAPEDMEGFTPHKDAMTHASDLIAFLSDKFNLCLGAAGYPEGHVAATSLDDDLRYLKLKVDNGAAFVIANYFYDNQHYFDFVERARRSGIEVPIIPGVMPIYNIQMMERLAALCGATVTGAVKAGIEALPPGDKQALNAFGISLATTQCVELIEQGAPGIHLYTMNRASSAVAIAENLKERGLI